VEQFSDSVEQFSDSVEQFSDSVEQFSELLSVVRFSELFPLLTFF
jgi:hypothetical protein